jgi:hypothetical protein
MYRISLLLAGRKTMQVDYAIRRFVVQGIVPYNAGFIVGLQFMMTFLNSYILFQCGGLLRYSG